VLAFYLTATAAGPANTAHFCPILFDFSYRLDLSMAWSNGNQIKQLKMLVDG
jgi:hypothetical protein